MSHVWREISFFLASSPPDFRTEKEEDRSDIFGVQSSRARHEVCGSIATDIQLGPRKNHNRPVESIPYSSAAIEGIKAIRAESKAGSRSRLGASRGYDSMIPFIKRHPPPSPIRVSHVPQCSTCIIDSPSFYFPSIKELLLVEQRKRVLSGRIFFILSSVNTALFSENPFLNATNLNKGEERVTKSFEFMKRSVGLFVEF